MQLDLFNRPVMADGEVVRLPMARLRNRVGGISRDLLAMSKGAGRRHWQKHIAEIRRERTAQGFSAKEIDQELDDYSRAVSIEMDIHLYYRSAPDGAA